MIIDTTQTKIEHELQNRVNLGFLYYVPIIIGKPESFTSIAHRIFLLHNNNLEITRVYVRQYSDSNWFSSSVINNQSIRPKWHIKNILTKNEALLECFVPKRPCPKLDLSGDIVAKYTCTDSGIWERSGVTYNYDLERFEIDMDYLQRKYWRDIKKEKTS